MEKSGRTGTTRVPSKNEYGVPGPWESTLGPSTYPMPEVSIMR